MSAYHVGMARRTRKQETFTYDEMGQVIKSATRLQQLADEKEGGGEVSMAQLRDIAVELKISPETLAQAIATSDRDMRSVRKKVRRKLMWFRHAGTYAAVSAAAVGGDLAAGGGLGAGSLVPVFVWGALVGVHAAFTFSGKGGGLEQRLTDRELAGD